MLTLSQLAQAPAWSLEAMRALPGELRGSLLRDWGQHLVRRYGDAAPHALRSSLGVSAAQLPDSPDPESWLPCAWQIMVTRLVAEHHLNGDLLALEPLLREDARRRPQKLIERVLSLAASPRTILGASSKIHRTLYRHAGSCEAEVGRHSTTITWRDSRLFEEPTWRLLQAFAIRALFDSLRAPEPELHGEALGERAFRLHLRY